MRREFINKIIAGTIISTTLCTLVPVRASAEWVNDYQNNWYYTQDNQKMTGWKKIEDKLYYFDDNGKMQKGWIKTESSWYFLQNNGALKMGWFKYDRNWYYSDLSGEIQKGTINIAGKVYIFDDNGIMKTNNNVVNGEFYTIGSDGSVAGAKVPTPDKEYDDAGNCLAVLKNSDSKASISPTYSSFSDVNKDNSISNDDPNEGRTFKVRFKDSNGAELKTKSVKKGKTVDLYAPTKDGYIFASWNTKSDGSGKSYEEDDDIKVKEDINLYAQWSDDAAIYVDGIIIKGSSYVTVNKTTQMKAEVSPSDATSTSVTWSVSDGTGKATIDSNGVLTGTVAGSVTVKATANDESKVSTTKMVTVSATEITVPVSKILIGSKTGVFRITASGGTLQMTASVYPDNANDQDVEWSVDNIGGSAEIDPNTGLLKAISNGVVTVTARAKDKSGVTNSTTVEITGQNVEISLKTITISGRGGNVINTDVAKGGTNGKLQMEATIDPITASNKALRWLIIEGNEFASINPTTGLITAKATGKVKVQAENIATGLVSKIVEITISNQSIKVTGITINDPGTISGEVTLKAVTSPAAVTNDAVKWSVINGTGSAEIGIDNGRLTPKSNGEVTVKAIATDGSNVSDTQVVKISGLSTVVPITSIAKVYGKDANGNIVTSVTKDDATLQMYADILPSYASTTSAAVEWTVIGSGATINKDTGVLKAVSDGSVTVRATSKVDNTIYKDGKIYIHGQITQAASIIVTSPKIEVPVGGTLQMSASVNPTEATYKDVKWYVQSGAGTADINIDSGLLIGKSVGDVTVIAIADDGKGIKEYKTINIISPIRVATITISSLSDSITSTNGTLQMSVDTIESSTKITPTNKALTWSVEPYAGGPSGVAGSAVFANGTTTVTTTDTDTNGPILKAVSNGDVKVKAIAQDGSKVESNSIIIKINQPIKAKALKVGGPVVGQIEINKIESDNGTLLLEVALIPNGATTTPASVSWTVEPYAGGPLKSAGNAAFTDGTNTTATATTTGTTGPRLQAVSNGDVKVKATGTVEGIPISGEYIVSLSNQHVLIESMGEIATPNNVDKVVMGSTLQLAVNITPSYADKPIWTVDNESIARIDTKGKLTPVLKGVVTVTASYIDKDNKTVSKTINITVS